MQLDRFKELVTEYDKSVITGFNHMFDLYDSNGDYIDSLYFKQVEELQEEDFIEFYLKD